MSPSSSEKPVILLVHGAWHRPHHYDSIITSLREHGYTVEAPALASAGDAETVLNKTLSNDVAVIKWAMAPYLESGREIVAVLHSYGGLPGSDSIVGETVQDRRAKGQTGGVKAVIYMTAFAAPAPGLSLWDFVGRTAPSWWAPRDGMAVLNENIAIPSFYNEVDEEIAKECEARLVQQSQASFESPISHAASEITAPKVCFTAELDHALPFTAQTAMANAAAAAKIISIPTGHSPFLQPKYASQIVDEIVKAAEA